MIDRKVKVIAYSSIIAFGVILMFSIGLMIIRPAIQNIKIQQKLREEQAKEFKEKSDSIKAVVIEKYDSIVKDKRNDSLWFIHEKESLARNYYINAKKYESTLRDIDTLNDVQLNSSFSVHRMLSDSAVKQLFRQGR